MSEPAADVCLSVVIAVFNEVSSIEALIERAPGRKQLALEEIADGVWNFVFYETLLGRIDDKNLTVHPKGTRGRDIDNRNGTSSR